MAPEARAVRLPAVKAGLALLRYLAPRLVRATVAASSAVLAVGTFAGLIRLLPWLVAPNLPLSVAWPFARALLATALEMALFVGLPLGWALALASVVDRGEARAIEALGTSPARLVGATAVLAVGMAAVGAAILLIGGAARPGRLAEELLKEARSACREGAPRAVDVPFLGMSWLCFEEGPPLLVGRVGGVDGMPFTASGARASDELDELTLDDVRLVTHTNAPLRVQVASATIRGIAKPPRGLKLDAAPRTALLFLTAVWLALAAGFFVLRARIGGAVPAAAVGVVGPLVAVGMLSACERSGMPMLAYLLVPLASSVAIFAAQAAGRCVLRRSAR